MDIKTHHINEIKIAEVISDETLVNDAAEGLQLLVDLYYQDFDRIVIYEKNLHNDFFDLKTGLLGEVLQKFSNFRVRLAIIGEFDKHAGRSFGDFIYESNNGRLVNFVSSKNEALARLSTH